MKISKTKQKLNSQKIQKISLLILNSNLKRCLMIMWVF